MKLQVRELGIDDALALGSFFAANDTPATWRQFSPFTLDHAAARNLLERRRDDRFFGGWIEQRLVAFGMLRGWDEGYSVPSFGLLVDASVRGQGLAASLVNHGLELAWSLDCVEVRATVNASNLASRRMLERAGYEERSRSPIAVDGEADEKLLMTCRRPPARQR